MPSDTVKKEVKLSADKIKYAIDHPEYCANATHEFVKDAHTLMASLQNLYEEHVDVFCITGIKVKLEITGTNANGNDEILALEEFGGDSLVSAISRRLEEMKAELPISAEA